MDKNVLHKISYGLYILTTTEDNKPFGCIINTVFQVTASPAKIAISLSKDNFTYEKLSKTGVFGVTILAESVDPSVFAAFGYKSGREEDKFASFEISKGTQTGVPLLPKYGLGTMECKVVSQQDAGSHTVFIADVLDATLSDKDADEITYKYYHQVMKGKAPKNAPTYQEESDTDVATDDVVHECLACGWEYSQNKGDGTETAPPGTAFDDLPDDWTCPVCGSPKSAFQKKE
ncbi:MAG: flavin reductase [Fibrobacteria bacterium]|nr:flavin reductase [Fibrobacteria bacterium]